MRVLCICHYGHSRSVALVRQMHHCGHAAIAAGKATAGLEALNLLMEWAEVIAVMAPPVDVPEKHAHKVTLHFDVGRDQWSNPYHPELQEILRERYRTWDNVNK